MIFQILILLGFLQLGSLITAVFHVPLPGSVVGMIFLFLFLLTGVMKLRWIEKAATLQLKHVTLLFIPPIVSLCLSPKLLEVFHWYILMILLVSSICSLLGTAFFVEWFEKMKRRKEN